MGSINRENDTDHNLIQSLLSKEISSINEHQHEDEDEQEFGKKLWIETKKLWHIVGPSIFSRVASFTMNVVTQAFAGHLGDVQLASISIANTVIVGFNFGLLLGMASALETLCGQAFGAKRHSMLGIYLQRSWIVLFLCCFLLLPFYIFATPILKLLGQPDDVAEWSGVVAIWLIPLHFSFAFQFPLQRFLQCQLKTGVIAWVSLVGLVVNVVLSWLLIFVWDFGLIGAAIALDVSWWILVFGMLAYTVCGGCPLTWTGFSIEAFSGLWDFFKLSFASGVMLCLENWYYRILLLMTGQLENATVAVDALSVCMTINGWEMMIPLAFFAGTGVVMEHHKDCLDADSSEVEYTDDLYDDEEHHSSSDAEDDVDGNAADDVHDESVQQEGSINNALVGERLVNVNSIASDEILKLEFGTVDEAYEFYYRYGRCKGFAIRKGDVRSNSSGIITMREFVCNKQGLRDKKHLSRNDRKRDHRRMTRTNCKARLRVRYKAKKGRYVVSKFEEGHNHELTPPKFTHLHPLYRKISEADSAQLDALQSHGIRTCHIMGYMVAQKGGYADVGFTKKDLYNYFDKKMRDVIKDGDVAAALKHLNVKSSTDPMLYAEYDVNIDGRMKSLFWADGSSRSDYFCFGDVLAFDATYKKNKYNYPLCIFSGCNHHSQTIIFGVALLEDETIESYKWVLNRFLECMENKFPKAVVTDGDGSMREAIKQVFPDASHRLCAWHLHKNAQENVKKTPFLEGFGKAMYSNFTPEQFEEFWSELIQNNELEENDWVKKTYANKSLWATAYLRDKFFGRIRTTSQCEAINAIVKTYVRAKGNIFEFMHNFEQVLRDYRNSELAAEFKSKFTEPVLTTHLRSIESDAAKIYTAEIFKEVKDEIIEAGAVSLKSKECVGDTMVYTLRKYREKGIEREVVYDAAS